VLADLESLGLLAAPHTSAGRMPTERGCACSSTG
jgi:heat-inducible transcriptional repressor